MPPGRRRLSAKQQRLSDRLAEEREVRMAAKSYREKLARGLKISILDHADKVHVNYSHLYNYLHGRRMRSQADADKAQLNAAESAQLADWLVAQAERGFPLTDPQIADLANYLIRKIGRVGPDWAGVGKQWVYRFRIRHSDRLARYWTKSLHVARADGLTPAHVQRWFALLSETLVQGLVPPSHIFAMDESGFLISVLMRQMVTGGKTAAGTKKKVQHVQSSQNRELVTVIATICADGTAMTPAVIFQGKNLMSNWVRNNPLHAHVGMSAKGYANGVINLAWIRQLDAETRHRAPNGEKRILIVDGHGSHYTAEVLAYAREHNIEILAYPPHTTHALQGLDVVLFAPLKAAYSNAVLAYERQTGQPAGKADFLTLFDEPWRQTFTPELIKEAFRKTGVWPVDAGMIRPEQMQPSVANSVHPGFGPRTPSPVRAIMSALAPSPQRQVAAGVPADSSNANRIPVTPPRQMGSSQSFSTPQRQLARNLLRQSSASFVLDRTVDPNDKLPSPAFRRPDVPSPTWDLGKASPGDSGKVAALKAELRKARLHNASQRRVLQSSQTQMALQGLRLDTLSNQLVQKTKKVKRNDIRSVIFKSGHSVVLTSDQSTLLVKEADERRAAASAAKEQRKTKRATTKAASEAEKARRQAIRIQYRADLQAWKDACAAIRLANPNKRRNLGLPPKPRNPLYVHKQTRDATEEPEPESEDGVESEDGSDTDTSDPDAMDVDLVNTDDDANDWEDW